MENLANYDVIRVFKAKAFERNLLKVIEKFREKVGVVVKADAYGIGIKNVLPIFEKHTVSNYFCQDIIEALKLKSLLKNMDANVFTFAGVQMGQEAEFVKSGIIPVCVSLEQIERFNDYAKKNNVKPKIGIHFDTGMNRTGLSITDSEILRENFAGFTSNLDVVLYLSHLYSAYDKGAVSNKIQLQRFKCMTAGLPKAELSLSASGGSFRLSHNFHFDIVRIGAGLYGEIREMEPVVSVYTKILQIREVDKGESIGYFGGFKARKQMKVAITNIGYKDGYSRGLSHTNKLTDIIRAKLKSGANFARSYMVIDGKYKCPVVGIISMNNTIIDVSNVPQEVLNKTEFVEVLGTNANLLDFREANGFVPCDLINSLLAPNPNAVDLTEDEFKKLKI